MKLKRLRSTSGSRRSYGYTGFGFREGVGVGRRWSGGTAEVHWVRESEQGKLSEKVSVQRENEGVKDSRTCSGSRIRRDQAEAGAGTSAARVATAAELGQKQCDVEDAGQDSTRLVWRRRGCE
jgi:hypothetical protein